MARRILRPKRNIPDARITTIEDYIKTFSKLNGLKPSNFDIKGEVKCL